MFVYKWGPCIFFTYCSLSITLGLFNFSNFAPNLHRTWKLSLLKSVLVCVFFVCVCVWCSNRPYGFWCLLPGFSKFTVVLVVLQTKCWSLLGHSLCIIDSIFSHIRCVTQVHICQLFHYLVPFLLLRLEMIITCDLLWDLVFPCCKIYFFFKAFECGCRYRYDRHIKWFPFWFLSSTDSGQFWDGGPLGNTGTVNNLQQYEICFGFK